MFQTAVCIALATVSGQFPDLVDIGGQYLPSAALEDPVPAEAQVASYDVSLNVPIVLGPKTFLIPGVGYHVDSVSFSNIPAGFTELRAFHAIEASLLFVQLLPKDWALSLRLAPGLAGDFRVVDKEMVRFSAVALATHTFSDALVLGGGGIASYSFGAFLPLPALYIEYKPIETLALEAFLPAFAQARWTVFDRLELGAVVDFSGNEYGVRDSRITDGWPCRAQPNDDPATTPDETVAQPDACLDHVAYSVGMVGLQVNFRVFSTVWLSMEAGHTFFRRLDLKTASGERVPGGTQGLPQVFVFRGGITWRIPRS